MKSTKYFSNKINDLNHTYSEKTVKILIKSFKNLTEYQQLELCKRLIEHSYFSMLTVKQDINKIIFIKCIDEMINMGYNRSLANYATPYNKKIINDIFDKLEIFK
jgi:hypothetical protein